MKKILVAAALLAGATSAALAQGYGFYGPPVVYGPYGYAPGYGYGVYGYGVYDYAPGYSYGYAYHRRGGPGPRVGDGTGMGVGSQR